MIAMPVTRTIGPLHFEDLDPKRFEDLVRQLVYDFKEWRRLEATGRAGSDDGFDARGYEITQEEPDSESEEEIFSSYQSDRLWLVQCKRERTISPAKLTKYLDDTVLQDGEKLHGMVFTAACDFSKKSRDLFREKCEAMGVQEWQLWGKAELEDLLFQPKNDHLLFAYFGVSLTVRKRTQKSEIRSRLAIKRKLHRVLEKSTSTDVLLRSPDALEYPYSGNISGFQKNPLWVVRRYKGMTHAGLQFTLRRHFAYLSDDLASWDAAFVQNDALSREDPWLGRPDDWEVRGAIYDFWSNLPAANQAWFELYAVIPFDSVIDIDELGDDCVNFPHIYVQFRGLDGPFAGYAAVVEQASRSYEGGFHPNSRDDGRIKIFEEEWRSAGIWQALTGVAPKEA
ncbi:restriction endonuclease [Pseudomonas aeruginosa]